jgi:hypothetical protein
MQNAAAAAACPSQSQSVPTVPVTSPPDSESDSESDQDKVIRIRRSGHPQVELYNSYVTNQGPTWAPAPARAISSSQIVQVMALRL